MERKSFPPLYTIMMYKLSLDNVLRTDFNDQEGNTKLGNKLIRSDFRNFRIELHKEEEIFEATPFNEIYGSSQ